jgi:pSer/pThr/pTyr-binding forkhead associated (FHA) protein
MIISYRTSDGLRQEFKLQDDCPLTIGRSQEADIPIVDDKVSRLHCGIRYENDEYVLKDLGSRNGTYLNEVKIERHPIHIGDKIRVGSAILKIEKEMTKGTQTVLREVEDEMAKGKGYSTILREIVNTAEND